jgi:hypothetical protein
LERVVARQLAIWQTMKVLLEHCEVEKAERARQAVQREAQKTNSPTRKRPFAGGAEALVLLTEAFQGVRPEFGAGRFYLGFGHQTLQAYEMVALLDPGSVTREGHCVSNISSD